MKTDTGGKFWNADMLHSGLWCLGMQNHGYLCQLVHFPVSVEGTDNSPCQAWFEKIWAEGSLFPISFYAWVQIEQSLCHLLDVAPKRWHFSGRIFWNSPSLPTEAFCGFRGLTVMLVCYVGPWMGRIPFSSKTITHLQSVRCPEEGRDNWELHSVALMTRVVICVALREITGIPKLSSVEWALSEYWWGHGIVLKIKPKSPSDENCIQCIMSSI